MCVQEQFTYGCGHRRYTSTSYCHRTNCRSTFIRTQNFSTICSMCRNRREEEAREERDRERERDDVHVVIRRHTPRVIDVDHYERQSPAFVINNINHRGRHHHHDRDGALYLRRRVSDNIRVRVHMLH